MRKSITLLLVFNTILLSAGYFESSRLTLESKSLDFSPSLKQIAQVLNVQVPGKFYKDVIY